MIKKKIMKVKVKEDVKKFEPIELTITIESEEELCDLWHRFNAGKYEIDSTISGKLKYKSIQGTDKWEAIDKLVIQRNLKK